jgi:hypothetical protein
VGTLAINRLLGIRVGDFLLIVFCKPIPEEDHLLGHNVNHQGETGQKA